MKRLFHRPPWRSVGGLLALCGALSSLTAAPAAAQNFYETGRSYYFGMGSLTATGGEPGWSVDAPTGALRLQFTLPKLPGRIGHQVGWFLNGQDGSNGPLGKGSSLSLSHFWDGGLVSPGHRRWAFNYEYDWSSGSYIFINRRDPEMLGAKFYEASGPPNTGTLVMKNGDQLKFEGGVLWRLQDRHGNFADVDTIGGRLAALRVGGSDLPRVNFSYDGSNRLIGIQYQYATGNPPFRSWTFSYNASGRLDKMTNPLAGETRFTWTTYTRSDGQVLPLVDTIIDPRGNVALNADYDSLGRVIKVTRADAGATTFSYTAAPGMDGTTTMTDPRSNVTSWSYVWPLINSVRYGYRLTSMTDAQGRQTTYAATHAGSALTTSITDFRNRVTTLNWDWDKGNLTGVTKPTTSGGTVTTTAAYEASCSHCTAVSDPLGRTASATVDPTTKNITQTVTPRNHGTSYTYDPPTGDITSTTPPVGRSLYYQRDWYGNATQVSDGFVVRSQATFDSASRLLTSTDANGKVTEFTWDALDRLTQIKQTLAGQQVLTRFEYDANSNRTALVDAKDQRWEWSYDARNRVIQDKNPLLQTRAYVWDKNSNLTKRTDRMGQVSEFTYGIGDRLQQETYRVSAGASPQATVTYTYNATTKLLDSFTDSEYGVTTLTYDNLDRLTTKATPQGAITVTLDNLGRRTAMQAPGQGLVSYGFDNNDNIISISQNSQATTLEYDPLDRLIRRTMPNTVSTEWTYNGMQFLNVMASKRNGVQFDYRLYERDWAGNLTRETINGVVNDYGYDDLNRIAWALMGGVGHWWSYDKVGNRLSQTVGSTVTNYTYNSANRLLTVNGAAASHDANGNLTAFAGSSYTWDVRGRLRTLAKPGFNYAFGYNQADLRTSKAVNGATTSFLLDGDSIVSETAGGVTKHLLQSPLIDQPLMRDGKWFVPANLGSTAALTDQAGTTVQTYGYKPFGELTNAPTDPNPFQFTGRENDGNTGLMYYRARYYAPEWGRFISEDPIGFEGGINQYAYCDNNPVNATDPTGLYNIPPPPRAWHDSPFKFRPEEEYRLFTWSSFVGFLGDPLGGFRDWGNTLGDLGMQFLGSTFGRDPARIKKHLIDPNDLPTPGGMSRSDFGDLIGWGSGERAAIARLQGITLKEIEALKRAGVTPEMARTWKSYYNYEWYNYGNAVARERARLMNYIMDVLSKS